VLPLQNIPLCFLYNVNGNITICVYHSRVCVQAKAIFFEV
jgi:hypothetical protein